MIMWQKCGFLLLINLSALNANGDKRMFGHKKKYTAALQCHESFTQQPLMIGVIFDIFRFSRLRPCIHIAHTRIHMKFFDCFHGKHIYSRRMILWTALFYPARTHKHFSKEGLFQCQFWSLLLSQRILKGKPQEALSASLGLGVKFLLPCIFIGKPVAAEWDPKQPAC